MIKNWNFCLKRLLLEGSTWVDGPDIIDWWDPARAALALPFCPVPTHACWGFMGFPAHLIRPGSNEIICRWNHVSLKALKITNYTKNSLKKKVKTLYQALSFISARVHKSIVRTWLYCNIMCVNNKKRWYFRYWGIVLFHIVTSRRLRCVFLD